MDGLKKPGPMRADRIEGTLRALGSAHLGAALPRAEEEPVHGSRALPRRADHLLDGAICGMADRPFLPGPDHLPGGQGSPQLIVPDVYQARPKARAHEVVVDDGRDLLTVAE
jgi:hypothetical protein